MERDTPDTEKREGAAVRRKENPGHPLEYKLALIYNSRMNEMRRKHTYGI
jgi:hypothetical protein